MDVHGPKEIQPMVARQQEAWDDVTNIFLPQSSSFNQLTGAGMLNMQLS